MFEVSLISPSRVLCKVVFRSRFAGFLISESGWTAGFCTRGGALSRDTLPIQNQPWLCPELPLYPSTSAQSAFVASFHSSGDYSIPNTFFHTRDSKAQGCRSTHAGKPRMETRTDSTAASGPYPSQVGRAGTGFPSTADQGMRG